MATAMHMDERRVDCLVLGHHDQDRKVSAKSVIMRAMTLCKNLSGYRELLLRSRSAEVIMQRSLRSLLSVDVADFTGLMYGKVKYYVGKLLVTP